jgi:hypothetical protein
MTTHIDIRQATGVQKYLFGLELQSALAHTHNTCILSRIKKPDALAMAKYNGLVPITSVDRYIKRKESKRAGDRHQATKQQRLATKVFLESFTDQASEIRRKKVLEERTQDALDKLSKEFEGEDFRKLQEAFKNLGSIESLESELSNAGFTQEYLTKYGLRAKPGANDMASTKACKLDYTLIPIETLEQVAKVFQNGLDKGYPREGYRDYDAHEFVKAIFRHFVRDYVAEGKRVDTESGLSVLAHVAANVLILLSKELEGNKVQHE